MTVRIHTPVSALPVDLATLRAHLRIDTGDHDQSLTRLCLAAAGAVSQRTGRQVGRATLEHCYARFPAALDDYLFVGCPPVVSIAAVEYLSALSAPTSWAPGEYATRIYAGGAEIRALENWPDHRSGRDAVVVRGVHGYQSADLPADLQHAILLLVGHWFEHPEAVITGTISKDIEFGVESLLGPWTLHALA